MNFFDAHLTVSGIAVAETEKIFNKFWNSTAIIPINVILTVDSDAFKTGKKCPETV